MKAIYIGSLQVHSNSTDVGYVVNNHSGFDSPDIRLSQYNRPGEHGAVVTNQLYGGRTITLEGRIAAATSELYQQRRRALSSAVRIFKDANAVSQPVLLKFQTMDDLLLQTDIYSATRLEFKERTPVWCEYYLELFASDFNLYDQSAQTTSITPPTGGGVTYPVIYPVSYAASAGGTVTINNAGTSNTFPTVTFNGPLTAPFINNMTTGETFQINRTLIAGETLVVDMQSKTMLLNGTTNALQYFVSSNTWLSLIPGSNIVTLGSSLSSDTGNVTITYRSAYIGV
jgi:phage-related protein